MAANNFDGLYSGPIVVTYGSAPVCGTGGEMSITVKDGKFDYFYQPATIKLEVSEDGSFTGYTRSGGGTGSGGGKGLHTHGRIINGALEATFITKNYQGPICSYQWSLKKK
jgi:hypothetical protein